MRDRRLVFLLLSTLTVAFSLGITDRVCAAEPPIFTLTDPRGDDHGDGTVTYPRREDLKQGDLDLLSLVARPDPEGTLLEATFARPIAKPESKVIDNLGTTADKVARFGFYTFNLDIYIDTDRVPGSGSLALLPGRKAEVDSANAWEKAICLTPRPFEAKEGLKRLLVRFARRDVKAKKGKVDPGEMRPTELSISEDVDKGVFFPTRVRVHGPTVSFVVPTSFLGGKAQPTWSYVVAVSGADIIQKIDAPGLLGLSEPDPDCLMILTVSYSNYVDRFATTRDDPLMTPIIDTIVPPGRKQEEILRDDDPKSGRLVRLPGVVPAEMKPQ
ncbi:MAG: glucodextranase DOMON-like domain-containing protein [Thermoanaerobaculia bacterium]